MLKLNSTEIKSTEWLKANVKSIYTTSGSDNTSDKYTHIPTSTVIDDMKKMGWEVVDAKEVKARKQIGYQKHLLIFRNDSFSIDDGHGDVVHPQIFLTNSSDGKNSFIFQAGLFRMICENGLVISTEDFGKVKIRHMGYSFEDLRVTINTMVEQLPLTVESLNKMKSVELEEDQILEFAKEALKSRYKDEEIETMNIDLEEIITPERSEDHGNDLWTVFNVIQEKLIRGNFQYTSPKGKTRKARSIKNFSQDLSINQKLYETALQYA